MAALTSQSIVTTGTTPSAITPAASDTIASGQFGSTGLVMRVITTGTASNISVLDPGRTPSGNPGTVTALAAPSTGARMLFIPLSAIDPATGVATVTSSSQTGLTYELYRV
ncbi:hypothetical protein ABGB07_02335 [Micromonosporaceae bacterium B7E4]